MPIGAPLYYNAPRHTIALQWPLAHHCIGALELLAQFRHEVSEALNANYRQGLRRGRDWLRVRLAFLSHEMLLGIGQLCRVRIRCFVRVRVWC